MSHRSLAIPSFVAVVCVSACAGSSDDSEEPIGPAVSEDGSAGPAPNGRAAPPESEPSNASSSSAVDDDVASFAADISPILQANCSLCHAIGALPRFASSDASVAYPIAVEHRDDIIGRLEQGTMPPSCGRQSPDSSGCISAADFDAIQRWVEGGIRE
jgi:hypothetical protein